MISPLDNDLSYVLLISTVNITLFSDHFLSCKCVPSVRFISADLLVLSYMRCVLPAISSVPLPPENISASFSSICYRLCESLETHCAKLDHFHLLLRIHSFIHSAFCLTTGPKPLPKPALHIVRSRASSFK